MTSRASWKRPFRGHLMHNAYTLKKYLSGPKFLPFSSSKWGAFFIDLTCPLQFIQFLVFLSSCFCFTGFFLSCNNCFFVSFIIKVGETCYCYFFQVSYLERNVITQSKSKTPITRSVHCKFKCFTLALDRTRHGLCSI